jgi:hypothetical protein
MLSIGHRGKIKTVKLVLGELMDYYTIAATVSIHAHAVAVAAKVAGGRHRSDPGFIVSLRFEVGGACTGIEMGLNC